MSSPIAATGKTMTLFGFCGSILATILRLSAGLKNIIVSTVLGALPTSLPTHLSRPRRVRSAGIEFASVVAFA